MQTRGRQRENRSGICSGQASTAWCDGRIFTGPFRGFRSDASGLSRLLAGRRDVAPTVSAVSISRFGGRRVGRRSASAGITGLAASLGRAAGRKQILSFSTTSGMTSVSSAAVLVCRSFIITFTIYRMTIGLAVSDWYAFRATPMAMTCDRSLQAVYRRGISSFRGHRRAAFVYRRVSCISRLASILI